MCLAVLMPPKKKRTSAKIADSSSSSSDDDDSDYDPRTPSKKKSVTPKRGRGRPRIYALPATLTEQLEFDRIANAWAKPATAPAQVRDVESRPEPMNSSSNSPNATSEVSPLLVPSPTSAQKDPPKHRAHRTYTQFHYDTIYNMHFRQERPLAEISRSLNMPYSTVESIVERMIAAGNATSLAAPLPIGPHVYNPPHKSRAEVVKYDADILETTLKYPNLTRKELFERFKDEHKDYTFCFDTFRSAMRRVGLSNKRPNLRPTPVLSEAIVKQRKQFASELVALDTERLIFIDEMGVSLSDVPDKLWCVKGMTPTAYKSTGPDIRINAAVAIGKHSVLSARVVAAAYNEQEFFAFVIKSIPDFLKYVARPIVVMDNVKFHHSGRIVKALQENGIEVTFLPPYTPQLNPIESFFGVVKHEFRKGNVNGRLKSYEDSKKLLVEILKKLQSTDFSDYYTHVQRCANDILLGLNTDQDVNAFVSALLKARAEEESNNNKK